jgi:hypothetical protein
VARQLHKARFPRAAEGPPPRRGRLRRNPARRLPGECLRLAAATAYERRFELNLKLARPTGSQGLHEPNP